jgi:hypothetical protein
MYPPSWFQNFPVQTRNARERAVESNVDNSGERVLWEISVFLAIALGAAALAEVLLRAWHVT